jgi:hypothetical protein
VNLKVSALGIGQTALNTSVEGKRKNLSDRIFGDEKSGDFVYDFPI